MRSRRSTDLVSLETDLPTTKEDVEALRRARPAPRSGLLEHPEWLQPPDWLPPARDRERTSAGWEPFELASEP